MDDGVKKFALVLIILILSALLANSSDAVELTDASIQYQKFAIPNFQPYFDRPARERLTLRLDSDVFPGVFFNNRIHGTTDETQYKWIGWNFQVGIRPISQLSLQFEHHSQHMLDSNMGAHFPVEDSLGLTLHLVVPKKRSALFGVDN
jgi:hypothetical protein